MYLEQFKKLFHIIENYVVYLMHDIFEGVGVFVIMNLLNQFILKDKYFTLDILNFKLKHFKFDSKISNRPPLITEDNLKKKKVNMSASEMKSFLLYAGILFGSLVPTGNQHWKLYVWLVKILNIVLLVSVSEMNCKQLNFYVEQLTSLYINLFSESLKPKFHHLLHYSYVISKTGPPNNFSAFRYETKHRISKLSAGVVASRVSITKTLAIKHQLMQANRFISKKGFINNSQICRSFAVSSKDKEFSDLKQLFLMSNINFDFECSIILIEKIQIHNTVYETESIILAHHESKKWFGKIYNIVLNSTSSDVYFVYYQLISTFDEHLMAYELTDSTNLKVILQSQLDCHKTFTPIKQSNKNYLVCEY
ncbi:hypothetical protein RN001_004966 [Aquatica leii]|uniref:Uncharacterized protein n=1 Tax=Aquatica leii TaxID=1421715 RepID=A0AAN7Q0K2_9COLE|nr:hypothetical protein RN001_004966 [Aquatica leii]